MHYNKMYILSTDERISTSPVSMSLYLSPKLKLKLRLRGTFESNQSLNLLTGFKIPHLNRCISNS
jgi:hypothetical protein